MHCDDREHKQNVTYFADSEGISSCFFSSNGDIHPDVNYPIYLLLISSKGEVWAVSRYFLPSCFTDAPICMSKQSLRSPSARNEKSSHLQRVTVLLGLIWIWWKYRVPTWIFKGLHFLFHSLPCFSAPSGRYLRSQDWFLLCSLSI